MSETIQTKLVAFCNKHDDLKILATSASQVKSKVDIVKFGEMLKVLCNGQDEKLKAISGILKTFDYEHLKSRVTELDAENAALKAEIAVLKARPVDAVKVNPKPTDSGAIEALKAENKDLLEKIGIGMKHVERETARADKWKKHAYKLQYKLKTLQAPKHESKPKAATAASVLVAGGKSKAKLVNTMLSEAVEDEKLAVASETAATKKKGPTEEQKEARRVKAAERRKAQTANAKLLRAKALGEETEGEEPAAVVEPAAKKAKTDAAKPDAAAKKAKTDAAVVEPDAPTPDGSDAEFYTDEEPLG
jgi:hypothetical protein